MNKTEFVAALAERTELKKTQIKKTIDAALELIQELVAEGESVEFIGFGSFTLAELTEREGFNPKTKEKITIAPRRVPKFKMGKSFKDFVASKN